MIRIAVISDTHIPNQARALPPQSLECFKKADMVIHAGDLVELSVLKELEKVCPKVVAVWGNMDPCEVKEKLPEKKIIEVGKYKIGITHGYGHPNKIIEIVQDKFKNDDIDIVIFGHSHTPFNEKKDGVLYFNPGSLTDKIFSPYNSYGIIEVNDKIEAKIIEIKNG